MAEKRLIVDDNFAVVDTTLGAAVADSGTFTVAYPTGFAQNDFTADLAASADHYIVIGLNDKWTAAASKMALSFGATLITVTNNSGTTWAVGSRAMLYVGLQDGNLVATIQLPVVLATIATATLTDARLGIDGTIEHAEFWVTTAATTAAKAATLGLTIDDVAVTGAAIALTSANATPLGKVIASTAITAANRLTRKSRLSVVGSGITAFVEGGGVLVLRVRRTSNV